MSQLPKLCVKISILRHRRMWVRPFDNLYSPETEKPVANREKKLN